MNYKKLYIDGKWVDSKANKFIKVENPTTFDVIASVPESSIEDVNLAVASSKNAFEIWKDISIEKRIDYINKVKENLELLEDELTDIIVKELGTTEFYSRYVHVRSSINAIDEYINIAKNYEFEIKVDGGIIRREPFGVVCALCPWNYPLLQIIQKVIPAILAGNTVVLKPSKNTPLDAYYLIDAFNKAGMPKGVINLVTGSGSNVGEKIASHNDVSLISFTGSKAVGQKMYSYAANGIKKLILELGGKSATILLEDGNIKKCVKTVLSSICNNTGQTCSALSRLIIPEGLKEIVEKELLEELKNYKIGNPFDKDVKVGPLASKKQYDKVKSYIEVGIEEGAINIVKTKEKSFDKGYFIDLVIFTNVNNDMRVAKEEIFGPVLSVITYKDLETAIKMANDNEYGLSGAVFGNENDAIKVAKKLMTGMVKINGKYVNGMPFGGYKSSGIGREGSVYGFEEYLDIKSLMI